MDIIYADHAATTPMSRVAIEALCNASNQLFGNPSSIHQLGREAACALNQARTEIAKCLNGQSDGIIFTSGGTEADNQALLTAAAVGEAKGKYHIITTQIEHHAILHTLQALEKRGFEITYLPVEENGILNIKRFEAALREDTVMASVMMANNEIGTIQPIKEIGGICRSRGVLFHTDAVQTVGHMKIDIEDMKIDLLSASAHKFHGPKGIGFLYRRKDVEIQPLLYGGRQEFGLRAGTESIPAVMSMAAALKDACCSMEKNQRDTLVLRDLLIEGLLSIPGARLNGDREKRLCGNVSVSFQDVESETLLLLLDQEGIAASSGSACTAGSVEPSHVIRAIGVPKEWAGGTIRYSICEMNTKEEILELIEVTVAIVEEIRQIKEKK